MGDVLQNDDGGALEALAAVARDRGDIERRESVAVRRARLDGYSWAAIATMLGISKQAVHKKYGKLGP
mgnify:CR=1 FL=1